MAGEVHLQRIQYFSYCLVTTALVHTVFFVDLHGADLQLLAHLTDHLRRSRPVIGVTDQQGHIECV